MTASPAIQFDRNTSNRGLIDLQQDRPNNGTRFGSSRLMRSLVFGLAITFVIPGCHLGNLKSPLRGFSSRDDDAESIDDVSGPLQRVLASRRGFDPNIPLSKGDLRDKELLTEGQRIYDSQQYPEASDVLTEIVKRRNPRKLRLFETTKRDTVYDPIREEAVFYLAESEYQQKNYAAAQKHYTMLIKDYPSTRYMDESTGRLFSIAQRWLHVDDFASPSEIQQVSFENEADQPLSSIKTEKKRFAWLPNLSDKSRPVVDTDGHALAALKTIWLNDPSGPRAADALMLAATFHLRSENYREASRMLTILREEFPKSKHLQTAFVLGSHVKLMSYQGPRYEEQPLEEARQLKESSLRLFGNLPEGDRIRRELKNIHEARAQREWEYVLFYEKKNRPKSMAVYCREIIRNFPDTQYASLATKKLGGINIAASTDGDSSSGSVQLEPNFEQPFQSEQSATPVTQPTTQPTTQPVDDGPVFESSEPYFDEDGPAPGRASFGASNSGTGRASFSNPQPTNNVGRARLQ